MSPAKAGLIGLLAVVLFADDNLTGFLRQSFLNEIGFLTNMPSGRHKSRTYRRVFVRTPGSKTVLQHRLRKPSKAICGKCHNQLAGVPRERPVKMRTLPKTAKRPERPYGGALCSKCTRITLVAKARS